MTDTYISFYLRNNRIHIFVEALRGIGSPKYVCFMIAEDGGSLVLAPYDKKDFYSHRVSPSVYNGKSSLEAFVCVNFFLLSLGGIVASPIVSLEELTKRTE